MVGGWGCAVPLVLVKGCGSATYCHIKSTDVLYWRPSRACKKGGYCTRKALPTLHLLLCLTQRPDEYRHVVYYFLVCGSWCHTMATHRPINALVFATLSSPTQVISAIVLTWIIHQRTINLHSCQQSHITADHCCLVMMAKFDSSSTFGSPDLGV